MANSTTNSYVGAGKIESIFFSQFHLKEGPKIVLQVPEDVITKETFSSFKYIIPKKQLYRRVIKLYSQGHTIIGYPISIEGEQFERNELCFNCCFVLNSSADSKNYEMIVRKINLYLEHEIIHGFLLNDKNMPNLLHLLTAVYNDLNKCGRCHYVSINNSSTLHLQIAATTDKKVMIKSYDVPVFHSLSPSYLQSSLLTHSDLVGKKIIPLINGDRCVSRIGHEADVSVDIVKDCIKKLVYHGAVVLVPLFQYSNVYMVTPKINNIYEETSLQDRCIQYSSISNKQANFNDIFIFYMSLGPGMRLADVCSRLNPKSKNIDEKKLIQFGLMEGIIRRLQKYPIRISDEFVAPVVNGEEKRADDWMNGCYSFDEICGRFNLTYQELNEKIENSPDIVVCWK